MQKRFLMVLLFAFVVALAASVAVYRSVVNNLRAERSKPQVTVLVASRDLPVGTLLKPADVEAAPWDGPIPTQSMARPADVVNRGVVEKVYKGEPIVESRLAPKGGGAGLAAIIPAGMRAVAVRVNDVVGVAGFVVPGMRVDVLVSGLPPGDSRNSLGMQTRTVLQNIEVLSAGQNMHKDAEGKPATVPVVNLLVTPEQAEVLSLASNEAKIQLVLRNPLDNEKAKAPGTAVAYLFGGSPAAKPQLVPVRRVAAPLRPVEHKETVVPPKAESVVVPVTMEVITGAKKDTVRVGVTVREEAAK